MLRICLVVLFSLLLSASDCLALEPAQRTRSSSSVKKERQTAARRLKQTQQKLALNKKEVGRKLNELMAVQSKMKETSGQITGLQRRIARIEINITEVSDSIDKLTHDVNVLKQSSAKALRDSRQRRQSMSALSMVLSSKSFNEAMRRGSYLQELERSRVKSTKRLQGNITELAAKKVRLDSLHSQQARAVKALEAQQAMLEAQQNQMQALVDGLKRQGKSLEQELNERKRRIAALNAELEKAIAEEQRIAEEQERKRVEAEQRRLAAEREAKRKAEEERQQALQAEQQRQAQEEQQKKTDKKAKKGKKPKPTTTPKPAKPDDVAVVAPRQENKPMAAAGATFAKSKGKLPFPVSGKYSIVGQFGRNRYGDLSKVEIDNPGIDILVSPGSSAMAVYPGTVSSIFNIDGYHHIVMVRHGEYLTIYANIAHLSVRKGDAVKAGQQLGTIYGDPADDDRTVLHFEVRKERAKLNPMEWLRH